MTTNVRVIPAVLLLCVGFSAGCSRANLLESLGAGQASHAILMGSGQEAAAGTELPEPVALKVLDATGRPVPNQMVNFVVTAGGGEVHGGAALTDPQGFAREWWTLGSTPGVNRLEARAVVNATGEAIVFGVFEAIGH